MNGRLAELQSRLVAWEMCDQLKDVFDAAMARYQRRSAEVLTAVEDDPTRAYEHVQESAGDMVLASFEEALGDLDSIMSMVSNLEGTDLWEEGTGDEY
jgi:hypothetical protein